MLVDRWWIEEFAVGQNDITMVVPVWNWPKGVYFLQFLVAGEMVRGEKFIVE